MSDFAVPIIMTVCSTKWMTHLKVTNLNSTNVYKRHNFVPNHPESKWDLAFHFILFQLELDKYAHGPTTTIWQTALFISFAEID